MKILLAAVCLLAGCGQANTGETLARLDSMEREARADYLRAVQNCQATAYEFGHDSDVAISCRDTLPALADITNSLVRDIEARRAAITGNQPTDPITLDGGRFVQDQ